MPKGTDRRRYLVAYDISDDLRRSLIERVCKGFGWRIQFSVFECLLDEIGRDLMERRLLELVDLSVDRLAIYQIAEGGTHRYGYEPGGGSHVPGRTRIV